MSDKDNKDRDKLEKVTEQVAEVKEKIVPVVAEGVKETPGLLRKVGDSVDKFVSGESSTEGIGQPTEFAKRNKNKTP